MQYTCDVCLTISNADFRCENCGSFSLSPKVQYQDENGNRCVFGTGTIAERSARMVDSYTVSSVSESDTVIVLEKSGGSVRYDGSVSPVYSLKVAHISGCGWIDIFNGHIDSENSPQYDRSEHMCIRPSELEILREALRKRERESVETAFVKLGEELSAALNGNPFQSGYRARSAMETIREALSIPDPNAEAFPLSDSFRATNV